MSETVVSGADKNKNANTKQSKSSLDQGQGHKQDQGLVLTTKPLLDREASFESVKGCPVASNSSFSLFGNKVKGSKVILSRSETVVRETKEPIVKEAKEIQKSSKTKAGKKRKSSGSSVKSETSNLSLESASVSSAGSASTYLSGVSGSNLSSLLTCDLHKGSRKSKGKKGKKTKTPVPAPSLSVQGLPENSDKQNTSQTSSTEPSVETLTSSKSKRSRSKSGGHKKGKGKGQSSSTVQSSDTVESQQRESVIKSVGKAKKSDSVKSDLKGASVTLSGASIAPVPSNTSQVTYIQPPKKRSKWDRQKESASTSVGKETPSTSTASSPPGRCGLRRKNRSKNTGSCASSR